MFKLKPVCSNFSTTIKYIMGYDIPNNCTVIWLGNIRGHVGGRDRYLAKVLLVASKKLLQEMALRDGLIYSVGNLSCILPVKHDNLAEIGKLDDI